MKLYHHRGRLYCAPCFPRCVGRIEKYATAVVSVKGAECHRCTRIGLPALTPTAQLIVDQYAQMPREYRGGTREIGGDCNGGVTILTGGLRNYDPTRVGDGVTKERVGDCRRALAQAGFLFTFDQVDALLNCALYNVDDDTIETSTLNEDSYAV